MNFEIYQTQIDRLEARKESVRRAAETMLTDAREVRGAQSPLTAGEDGRLAQMHRDLADADEQLAFLRGEQQRLGCLPEALANKSGSGASAYANIWSQRVAEKLTRSMSREGEGESRAVVSGSIDIPTLVEPEIVAIAQPARLVDLLVNRRVAPGYAIEYFRQTVRTNNANVVADGALKPTSVFTVVPVTDHVRVLAHLSEETPQRIWEDHSNLQSWLTAEMFNGLANALESQVIAGSGSGENFTGILGVAGTTQVAYVTDVPTTLRSAVTALQVKGEIPNAWVMNPADAAAIDLARWGTAGGWLSEGFTGGGGAGSSSNIFGSSALQRVVSNSVPAGVAVLADWSKCAIYERQSANLAIDVSGALFTHNTFIARAEMRAVSAVLRPSAFAIVDLTP